MPISTSWTLVPDPPPAPSAPAPAVGERAARTSVPELLGFGLLRPFRRDRKADFAADGGEALIRSAVGQILGTMAGGDATSGELPWRTEFGSRLQLLRHQPNDVLLEELARVYVTDALARWEPRVVVTAVQTSRERVNGATVLAIRLRYDVVDRQATGGVLLEGVEQRLAL